MALALGTGCGFDGSFAPASEFGATPGGVQDMGLARALVAEGRVPPPEAFVVEGMFSEHDLPLAGEPCSTTLCLRAGMGVSEDEDGVQSAWLQVGFSSTIDPETYERPTLTVVGVVDTSGSMTGTPLAVSKAMLNALIDELGPDDRFGLVTYGSSVHTELGVAPVRDRASLHRAVNRLTTDGSTNMEAGLERAFGLAVHDDGSTAERRVWLFTDVRPNVGFSTASEFERMASSAADQGVGLTVFGVGLGLGQEVMVAMSHLRGGNAFSLFETEDVAALMEESWPWMVSPIAHELRATVRPADGLELVETYGIPADATGTAEMEVASIFLSRNRGAILARLLPWSPEVLSGEMSVAIEMSYTTPEGETITEELSPSIPFVGEGKSFTQPIVEKTVALAVLVRAMRRAAETYGSEPAAATRIMEEAVERIRADALALSDPALDPEVELAEDLLELMAARAPQGDLYSGSGYY